MASTIAAVTTGGGGVVTTADATGNLNLLAGTTTVVALTTAGATVSGALSATGATTLGSTLVVAAASNSLGVVINGRSSDNLGAIYFYANDGTTNYATITTSASEFRLSAVPAASVQTFYTNASERMRIDSSGNVGIGTSSPAARLHVKGAWSSNEGQFQIDADSGQQFSGMTLQNNGTYKALFYNDNTNSYTVLATASGSNQPLLFAINETERMRIDSSGNVRIGTTTGNSDSKSTIYGGATNSSPCIELFKGSTTNTTAQVFARFQVAQDTTAVASGSITSNGAAAAAFTAWSDSRLKENITDLPSQLANIMALRPVEFDYVESMGGGHQIGFIAQDVQAIYPDLVGESSDGMLTLTDMNKNDARLIKCIQEQQALILALTDRIAALEAK